MHREREAFGIPQTLAQSRFVEFLTTQGRLTKVEFLPDWVFQLLAKGDAGDESESGRSIIRYVWGDTSPFALGLSLRSGAYLSHGSAVFFHDLTDQVPKTIYVNKEQTPKPKPSGRLSQDAINRAFGNAPRKSKYIFHAQEHRFVLLSGKNTKGLGVMGFEADTGEPLLVTNLERTLIDVTVRPAYAGGAIEVLNAFRGSKGRLSVNKLVATLKKLNYVYPYHQAIGFLMERAGFDTTHLAKLRRFSMDFDFYLTHKMSNPEYSREWRLYYPQGL